MFKKLPIQRVVSSDREILNPINMTELKRKMTNLCLSIFFFFFFNFFLDLQMIQIFCVNHNFHLYFFQFKN